MTRRESQSRFPVSFGRTGPGAARPEKDLAASYGIFLIQDHPLMIVGTASFLESRPEFSVCGSAQTPEQVWGALRESAPELVVYELTITGRFGFSFLSALRKAFPTLPILVYSYHEEVIFARRALQAGASGYLMKVEDPEKLIAAIKEILEGAVYLGPRVLARMAAEEEAARSGGLEACMLNGERINSLSNRELQIFQFLGEGFPADRIEVETGLSTRSIRNACYRMRKKLELSSDAELIQCAHHWAYHEGDFS